MNNILSKLRQKYKKTDTAVSDKRDMTTAEHYHLQIETYTAGVSYFTEHRQVERRTIILSHTPWLVNCNNLQSA